jgi:hypothetical protein
LLPLFPAAGSPNATQRDPNARHSQIRAAATLTGLHDFQPSHTRPGRTPVAATPEHQRPAVRGHPSRHPEYALVSAA